MLNKPVYYLKLISSLEKVFLHQGPGAFPALGGLSALRGETVSFQAMYGMEGHIPFFARLEVESPVSAFLHIRQVLSVPCGYPAHAGADDNYLDTRPGLYPDLLRELEDSRILFTLGQWKALWVDAEITDEAPAGVHPITLRALHPQTGEELCSASTQLTIHPVSLPTQRLLRTEWFHGDCLADYYGTAVFSPRHWEIMEEFVSAAARRGCNMLLTPQFTPPLDTAVGGERTTIQLIEVRVENGEYSFGFERLEQWSAMCRRAGIGWLEMSHLFTQWGAACAPKIIAAVDGRNRQLFGWDTPATGEEYTRFLRAYLPRLTETLEALGWKNRVIFHISDEPMGEHLERYRAARQSVAGLLEGWLVADALSDYEIYQESGIAIPICANNHIEPFLEHQVPHLWSYYCTSQGVAVSNRFCAMPSARNRIWGVQLYKYGIEGCLHWGYNFYNTYHSVQQVNPYLVTDAGGVFPSGDPFLVYPGADGKPEESVRMMVLAHAMADIRALSLLEELAGRDYVLSLLDEGLDAPITFTQYPASPRYLLDLREKINLELSVRTR